MPTPTYTEVADRLAARIQAGEFPADTQLPSFVALADEYGVTRDIVKRAMVVLRDRRLVVYVQGRGYWVSARRSS